MNSGYTELYFGGYVLDKNSISCARILEFMARKNMILVEMVICGIIHLNLNFEAEEPSRERFDNPRYWKLVQQVSPRFDVLSVTFSGQMVVQV